MQNTEVKIRIVFMKHRGTDMNQKIKKWVTTVVFFICFIPSILLLTICQNRQIRDEKDTAKIVLQEMIISISDKMRYVYNYTDSLDAYVRSADTMYFSKEQPIIKAVCEKEEVLDAFLLWKSDIGLQIQDNDDGTGKRLAEDYPFRLALLTKDLVVYGPVWSDQYNQNIIPVIRPLYKEYEGDIKEGCVAVILNAEMITDSFPLEELSALGYDYELWLVSAENGHKTLIEDSGRPADFSDAIQASFDMPAKWTLSLIPEGGWGLQYLKAYIVFFLIVSLIIAAITYFIITMIEKRKVCRQEQLLDKQTGLMNSEGLGVYFKQMHRKEKDQIVIFMIILDNLDDICGMLRSDQRDHMMRTITDTIKRYTQNENVAFRLSQDNFMMIFQEIADERQIEDLKKELEIDLIQCVNMENERLQILPRIIYEKIDGECTLEEILCRLYQRQWKIRNKKLTNM